MRSTWTDSRLDDFAASTDRRFDTLERRMDDGFREVRGEIGALQRSIIQVGGGLIAAQVAMMATLIATQF